MKTRNKRRGQALIEYALIVCGIAMIASAAVALLGHKTSDLLGAMAMIIPGAHTDDNGQIVSGKLIATTGANVNGANQGAALDLGQIVNNGSNQDRITQALGGNTNTDPNGGTGENGVGGLIQEAPNGF
jgi:hypothetical protein